MENQYDGLIRMQKEIYGYSSFEQKLDDLILKCLLNYLSKLFDKTTNEDQTARH